MNGEKESFACRRLFISPPPRAAFCEEHPSDSFSQLRTFSDKLTHFFGTDGSAKIDFLKKKAKRLTGNWEANKARDLVPFLFFCW